MGVSSGFFNSIDSDRRYDADQFGSIFDGVIEDGVYSTVGDHFKVTPKSGNVVSIGTGRGWFDHTWILNTGNYSIDCGFLTGSYQRYDMIAIVVDKRPSGRDTSIQVIRGTSSSNPIKPSTTKTKEYSTYPIAYIRRYPNKEITTSDIENCVGTKECPFVLGVVKSMTIEQFTSQWEQQWKDVILDNKDAFNEWSEDQKYEYEKFLSDTKSEFESWFQDMKLTLTSNQAGVLYHRINYLYAVLAEVMQKKEITDDIYDSFFDDNVFDDSYNPVRGNINFKCPFPPGTVLQFINDTDPNEIYPKTTWQMIQGVFLKSSTVYAGGVSDLGETGGAKSHTLTVAELPAHSHHVGTLVPSTYGFNENNGYTGRGILNGGTTTNVTSGSAGSNKSFDILPPYLTVNTWARIS